jgi:PIN domain nuclease of toxin-antitoxin system
MPSLSASHQLLLDTHVWLWLVEGDPTLNSQAREAIRRAVGLGTLRLAAISVWEVAMLAARERIVLGKPTLEWVEAALTASRIDLAPMTPEVSVDSCNLPGRFHREPADRIIVATARITGSILITRDRRILDYAAEGHVSALPA